MSDNNKLQKKNSEALKEKTQYALAFGVIATMLFVAGFPMFVIFFFGIFAYFLWKTFSSPSPNGTREIFEFYLSANEILRDDERRWFGFEVQEVVARGERILQVMNGAPPLVHFTLGALYNKMGDHKSAVNHLSYVVENENSDEATYVYPSPELRNYVRILRKIEREPAEAPQTSAAVRALERARRNRSKTILESSRAQLAEQNRVKREESKLAARQQKAELASAQSEERPAMISITEDVPETIAPNGRRTPDSLENHKNNGENIQKIKLKKDKSNEDPFANRKPITEVLHDIYDRKA